MTENAGKKRFIKDFLQDINNGAGFVDEIRIERVVRQPGSDAQGSMARSLSGRPISNITHLLEDDLRHTFDEGYFTFRFVAALVGSGKTSLLTYLYELIKTKPTYRNYSVVIPFQLSDVPPGGSNSQSFGINLYCHMLAHTFWELLHNPNLLAVRNIAESILSDYLESHQVAQLTKIGINLMPFRSKFNTYFVESGIGLEEFFFDVISQVSAVEPRFTFVYLIDELDALQEFVDKIKETRLLYKQLIRRAFQQFKSRIRLLIYLVGTTNNVQGFIAGDSVLDSLVSSSIIELNKGYSNEFEIIKEKINERIKGAYKGYKYFEKAWQEIQNIPINPSSYAGTLRKFCQEYAGAVLEIHGNYFEEAPEQRFEGNARQLVEAQCRQQWVSYLSKAGYTLSAVSTTTVLAGHAFDCYVELLHNSNPVARAFGEAKNYELLSGHLQTFEQWLKDVNFRFDGNPPDLAFMIAPSCPSLLQRKLELKKIQFIQSDKATESTSETDGSVARDQSSEETHIPPNWVFSTAININKADRASLIAAFRGTGIKQMTIDKLVKSRQYQRYRNLDDLVSNGLISTQAVRKKLQEKLDKGNICF